MRQKFLYLSRGMILISLASFIGASILVLQHIELTSLVGMVLFVIGALLFCLNLAIPGVLVLFKVPWLAHAWLIGRNPIVYSDIPWEKLSSDKKSQIYNDSVVSLIVVIVFTYWAITTYIQK